MPKKVLFILHLPPPVHGAAVVGKLIFKYYYRNDLINKKFINLGISNSIENIGQTSLLKFFKYINLIKEIILTINTLKPDLCYITLTSGGVGFLKDFPIVLIVKALRVKTIFHFHNKGVSLYQDKIFYNILYRLVFYDSQVILLSKYLYKDISKYVSISNVFICPNGLPDKLTTYSSQNYKTHEKVTLLFYSNLIRSKGVYTLVDACKILKSKNIDFICQIAGNQGDINYEELKNYIIINSLIDEVKIIYGYQNISKDELFKNSHIFVLPTKNDCFPLVIIEAMQYSLPVVSTCEGGIPDVVAHGKTGLLSDSDNLNSISTNLEFLINNSSIREKMGLAGRKKYEKEYTLDIFRNNFGNILNKSL